MWGFPKTNQLENQVKHLLIILSILLLSSFVTSCDKKEETLYRWETSSGIVWKRFGDKEIHRVYKGEWKNGEKWRPNGLGVMTYPDGHKYVGEWKNGKYNGQGTSTYPDGRKFVGEFKDGSLNGQGTYTNPDGGKYVGRWKDDKRNGQGTYTYNNGGKYVGEFKDGTPWNLISYNKDGKIISKYVNGKEIKQ